MVAVERAVGREAVTERVPEKRKLVCRVGEVRRSERRVVEDD